MGSHWALRVPIWTLLCAEQLDARAGAIGAERHVFACVVPTGRVRFIRACAHSRATARFSWSPPESPSLRGWEGGLQDGVGDRRAGGREERWKGGREGEEGGGRERGRESGLREDHAKERLDRRGAGLPPLLLLRTSRTHAAAARRIVPAGGREGP
eukprot:1996019-Rhodomonas_salina.2